MGSRIYRFIFAIPSVLLSVGLAFVAFAREMVEIAFPQNEPRELVAAPASPPRVIGLPSLRAFRDSFLSRLGDGRKRSPLSVAFVT